MIQHAPANSDYTPVYLPQLSAARPRGGMRNLGELVECLIRTYEAQARVLESYSKAPETGTPVCSDHQQRNSRAVSSLNRPEQQATFGWY